MTQMTLTVLNIEESVYAKTHCRDIIISHSAHPSHRETGGRRRPVGHTQRPAIRDSGQPRRPHNGHQLVVVEVVEVEVVLMVPSTIYQQRGLGGRTGGSSHSLIRTHQVAG